MIKLSVLPTSKPIHTSTTFWSHELTTAINMNIPYMAKHLKGKTFTVRAENGYSLENFHGGMPVGLYYQTTRP